MISFCFVQIFIFSPFGVLSEQCADLEDSLPDWKPHTHPQMTTRNSSKSWTNTFSQRKTKIMRDSNLVICNNKKTYLLPTTSLRYKKSPKNTNITMKTMPSETIILIKTTRNGRIRVKAIRQGWTLLPSRDPQWTRYWRRDQPQSDQNGKEDF